MSVPGFKDIPTDINQIISDHIKLYLSDPVKAHIWDARPVGLPGEVTTLLLTTIGRKSGKKRSVPLLYVDNGDTYLIIGSKGGNVDDPIWFMNLQETPECEIRVAAFHTMAMSSVLTGEERDAAWKKITERHHVYAKYQDRAPRQIPVVKLTPIGEPLS
jgi:deazaflavin-dependent oxidoreductase (nitroreductase family)